MANQPRVGNIYHMLSYAFRALREGCFKDVATEEFATIHELFAEIISRGVAAQVRRGLYREYLQREEVVAGIRGRICITETVSRLTFVNGRLVCAFDEFAADTPHNQIIKAVLLLLLRSEAVSIPRKRVLRRLLPYFGEVADVAPGAIRWGALRYDRNSAAYRTLLGICRLVIDGLLLTDEAGAHRLQTWLNDESMAALYERFVRSYYQQHHPEFKPRAQYIPWDTEQIDANSLLPTMKTDVTMQWRSRTLILDTKWYSHTMQRHYLSTLQKYRSDNLYQIYTYVKNRDRGSTGNVAGMLLYAQTDELDTPDQDIVIGGNQLSLRTLDLTRDWREIVAKLESLCDWLRGGPVT